MDWERVAQELRKQATYHREEATKLSWQGGMHVKAERSAIVAEVLCWIGVALQAGMPPKG